MDNQSHRLIQLSTNNKCSKLTYNMSWPITSSPSPFRPRPRNTGESIEQRNRRSGFPLREVGSEVELFRVPSPTPVVSLSEDAPLPRAAEERWAPPGTLAPAGSSGKNTVVEVAAGREEEGGGSWSDQRASAFFSSSLTRISSSSSLLSVSSCCCFQSSFGGMIVWVF